MKARLNLTIDQQLLEVIKSYAASKQTSVSELVETYFKTIVKPNQKYNILDLIESLPKPTIAPDLDLKKAYYEAKSELNGT
jgi:hypothetical protein